MFILSLSPSLLHVTCIKVLWACLSVIDLTYPTWDFTDQLCKFFLATSQKQRFVIESFIMDVRKIKFLIQDRRGRHRHGEGIVIGLMPVNNVLCHNVTARVMWCHDVYNQMHFWHILMFWCKAQPFTSLATTDSLYTSIKHSLKHSSRSDIHKYFQDYGPFKIFRGSLKIPNYV